jgi:hypothetical protein
MKGELPFSSPCVVGHEITGEVVDHGAHTPAEIVNRYILPVHRTKDILSRKNVCLFIRKNFAPKNYTKFTAQLDAFLFIILPFQVLGCFSNPY